MKQKIIQYSIIILSIICLNSCKGSWLMYDTDQKDHIFFKDSKFANTFSFALISEDEVEMSTKVFLMGKPSKEDRTFKIEFEPSKSGDSIKLGVDRFAVLSAIENEEFEVEDLVFPAGATEAELKFKVKRSERMKNNNYIRIGFRLLENENFTPLKFDDYRSTEVINPCYYLYVIDGEPSCPKWWRASNTKPAGWNYYIGNFYPQKYRKFLELFHDTKTTSPTFYNHIVDMLGENLDSPNVAKYGDPKYDDEKNADRMLTMFWVKNYSAAWAKYVLIPLYNYYLDYYSKHPDDPNFEQMGDEHVNLVGQTGWGNPMEGRFGLLN